MSMIMDLVWQGNGGIEFRTACAECAYASGPFYNEDTARSAYFGHICVGAAQSVPA
jgi:hypothetical protein